MRSYLFGYQTPFQRLTLAQLDKQATWYNLDPEIRRRLLAMFDFGQDNGHDVGIGNGWRSSAQQEQVFRQRYRVVSCPGTISWGGQCWMKLPGVAPAAPPGRSYHETTPNNDGAIAADLIGDIAWADSVAHQFGLRSLASLDPPNNELWHHQPIEVATARRNYDGKPIHSPTPTPIPDLEDDMAAIAALYEPTADLVAAGKNKTFLLRADGGIRHASGPDVDYANWVNARQPGSIERFPITGGEHYDQLDSSG